MSFYIRKSIGLGPFRLNFSKSGIGVSAGVKGARISTGPRGTYIHLGSKGVYYRQRIAGSIADTPPSSRTGFGTTAQTHYESPSAASINNLVESSSKETISQVNSRIQQPTFAWVVGIVSTVTAGAIAYLTLIVSSSASTISESAYPLLLILPLTIATLVWGFGMWITWTTYQQEKVARTTTLQYDLDDDAKRRFAAVQNSLADLSKSVCIWRIVS
jgi:hypothetical protein